MARSITVEERTLKALREAKAITGPELDLAIAALTATEPCPKCGGDGALKDSPIFPGQTVEYGCERCEGTGQLYVIR